MVKSDKTKRTIRINIIGGMGSSIAHPAELTASLSVSELWFAWFIFGVLDGSVMCFEWLLWLRSVFWFPRWFCISSAPAQQKCGLGGMVMIASPVPSRSSWACFLFQSDMITFFCASLGLSHSQNLIPKVDTEARASLISQMC